MTLFEKATRAKYRFNTTHGNIGTEDLWDLPLETLDTLAQDLNKQVKEGEGESFIQERKPTRAFCELKNRLDVVKRIIEVKLGDKDAAEKAAKTRAKKQRALEILEKRSDESLEELSDEELKEMAGVE